MTITIEQAAKRYQARWILRNVNLRLQAGGCYAFTGPNGSGKTTLLQLIAGFIAPTSGKIIYERNGGTVSPETWYRLLSFAAPYLSLIDEFTVMEQMAWQARLKPLQRQLTPQQGLDLCGLTPLAHQRLGSLSSGQRQRLMLALALLADTPVLLLDEPGSNLDREAVAWFQNMLQTLGTGRLVVVASNQEEDIAMCSTRINVLDFK